jgi:hypothetical protein
MASAVPVLEVLRSPYCMFLVDSHNSSTNARAYPGLDISLWDVRSKEACGSVAQFLEQRLAHATITPDPRGGGVVPGFERNVAEGHMDQKHQYTSSLSSPLNCACRPCPQCSLASCHHLVVPLMPPCHPCTPRLRGRHHHPRDFCNTVGADAWIENESQSNNV